MEVSVTGGEIAVDGSAFRLHWSVACKSKYSGQPSGDGFLITRSGSEIRLAVVDGTGSGIEAGEASERCLRTLSAEVALPLEQSFHNCHRALAGSRGAALGLASIDLDGARLRWGAIGDIDGLLAPANEGKRQAIVQRGGTLGLTMPSVHLQDHQLAANDMIVLVTDGIAKSFRSTSGVHLMPKALVRQIAENHARPSDDCLVLALTLLRRGA